MMSFGDNPEAPQPREMIDLEVLNCNKYVYIVILLIKYITWKIKYILRNKF